MAEVIITQDAQAAADLAATAITNLIRHDPSAVLGLATGPLAGLVHANLPDLLVGADLTHVRGFALDEYVGIDPRSAQSRHRVLQREVADPPGLNPGQIHAPDGSVTGLEHAEQNYEHAISATGGVHLQVLEIGRNGRIGFNEPGSSLAFPTHVAVLSEQTRRDHSPPFGSADPVPRLAITQGLATILRTRRLILLACGEEKAAAIAGAVEGAITASLPASVIQLHPHATVITDEPASSQLAHADYYRYAYDASHQQWHRA